MLQQISDIVEGTFNNVTNRYEDLFLERIKFCNKCPIIKDDEVFGLMCDNKKWLNPITNKVSYFPLDGYMQGCGCILESKTRVPHAVCPAGKW